MESVANRTRSSVAKRPFQLPVKSQAKDISHDSKRKRSCSSRTSEGGVQHKQDRVSPPKAKKKGTTKTNSGPTFEKERKLWQAGKPRVAGVDEAGRGPLAGPVVAAACIIPDGVHINGIDDSKKLTHSQREEIYEELISNPRVECGVRIIGPRKIDDVNILQATMLGMEQAVEALESAPDFVLVDGPRLPAKFSKESAEAIVKGDAKCVSIAAASVLAKVTRDRIMLDMHEKWPQYGFADHKGYGTATHMAAVKRCGPCEIHRWTFAPIKGNYPPPTTRDPWEE
ncbi:hypothetical protein CYMTET_11342 [Cymbomonas tetramitiformis]|uniref:Ribonuclease n=1 Tax=Cymbomonas tetramitiformis TaxID=36881 RepID=A0AAE0GMH9_9CHLO|nr:hypothetical protein CYMTET_11342 [Cymbomonas tetramitiformis]